MGKRSGRVVRAGANDGKHRALGERQSRVDAVLLGAKAHRLLGAFEHPAIVTERANLLEGKSLGELAETGPPFANRLQRFPLKRAVGLNNFRPGRQSGLIRMLFSELVDALEIIESGSVKSDE